MMCDLNQVRSPMSGPGIGTQGRRRSAGPNRGRHGYSVAIAALAMALFTGCSAKLLVSRQLGDDGGLPIRVDIPVIVTTTIHYSALPVDQVNKMLPPPHRKSQAEADALCARPGVKETLATAPLGDQYFVNIDPADLAKNEFEVEWAENGRLKRVSMNSDPSATIKESAAALETLLPFVGVTADSEAPAEPATATAQAADKPALMADIVVALPKPLPAAEAKALFCVEASSKIEATPLSSLQGQPQGASTAPDVQRN